MQSDGEDDGRMGNPCVAHRGWSGRAPENTMAAIRLALNEPMVEWIEIDVQLSKDHIPVVIHDYWIRRTTDGKGQVKDWTAAELAALDAGSWFSLQYAGEHVPTLEEVLSAAAGKCKLNIELKTDGLRYPFIETKVIDLVRRYGMESQVVITSFYEGVLYRVRKLSKEVRTGLITDIWRNTLPRELDELESDFLSIGYSRLNKERIDILNEYHIQTMAWTLNDVKLIRRIMSLDSGIMICTDYPDRYREAALQQTVGVR